jgi:2,4-dienoyl-CoA reductase-like NADH-dependent reductase (Old Yellow Enzyme family)
MTPPREALDLRPLFTPLHVGSMRLPNRFVLPGMQRRWVHDGAPAPRLAEYYRRRVTGGVGLIISESVAVDHPSATRTDFFARLDKGTIPAWAHCIAQVKEAGGHILLQLWHEGAMREEGGDGPWAMHPTLSPSGLARADRPNGRAASLDEIAAIRAAFVRSARMAQDAGADGVEVHGAHGFLLDQFLWSVTNRRDDGYGGDDVHDRARLPAEIVAGIRAACGSDFVISFRFSQWKEADYAARIAQTPSELGAVLTILREAGTQLLHASTRRFWMPEWPDSDLGLAGWARRLSGLPTITVGSVGLDTDVMQSFDGAEGGAEFETGLAELSRRFARGEFDLVSVGRSQISDPDWVRKVHDGRFDEIRVFSRADLRDPDGLLDERTSAPADPMKGIP